MKIKSIRKSEIYKFDLLKKDKVAFHVPLALSVNDENLKPFVESKDDEEYEAAIIAAAGMF